MQESYKSLNPNPLVQFLDKPSSEFKKADLIKFVEANNIKMINFRYVAEDGRLKALNFIINNKKHLDNILSTGERVDGSSLFSYIEAGSSDLYVIPRYKTAFLNPFTEIPTLDILCSYYDKDGNALTSSPDNIMRKAQAELKRATGYNLDVMGELEYYVISPKDDLYIACDQRGYHETTPYAKWEGLRCDAMQAIAQCGGLIKYGHSEVGNFSQDNMNFEQNEIEFLPTNMENAADSLLISKWILRMLSYRYGVTVSFAPKIIVGKAGSGLHIHTKLVKDGKSVMIKDGKLSDEARKIIAGYLDLAPSLTAFGNTIPTSYLRLVPHQEAPTNICWGDRNRSVLVRVPLGWTSNKNMSLEVNPLETEDGIDFSEKQTAEFRCPDGSANIYLLLAGLAVAARHGLEMNNSLELAEKLYVDVNIFNEKYKDTLDKLDKLPTSCYGSAEAFLKQAEIFKKYGVFTQGVIEGVVNKLKSYNDKTLSEDLYGKHDELRKLVNSYIHCS
ncbi:MAG: glutamine synthetase family protein [Bacteroidota bacterium]|nr:glutamine synthetase family protein [Bacteroidota bacterium]